MNQDAQIYDELAINSLRAARIDIAREMVQSKMAPWQHQILM